MLNISRRCIPYTPFDKEISSAVVTLVSATGVYAPGQESFPTEDPGDTSYRDIPADAAVDQLRIAHHHYDHSEADGDPNIVFPLRTLHELAAEGFIGGVHPVHFSYGFTTKLKELYATTFPEIADRIDRSKTRLVVMTAGCPETCHRTIGNLAREIEARGVPTVIISASPAATESVRPPRAVTWDGAAIGRILGSADDAETARHVLRGAIDLFHHSPPPGRVVRLEAERWQLGAQKPETGD